MYLFICSCAGSPLLCGLSLVKVGGGYFVAVHGLIMAASLVGSTGCRFTGLVGVAHELSYSQIFPHQKNPSPALVWAQFTYV